MTIEDIAKLANTSVATVSRVINNDMHVSPATRKRVQKVIAENDYRPNFAGKNLRQNKTYQLLAVLPTITNPFFSRVIEGLSDTADQNGYSLTFVVSDRDVKKEKSYLDRLMSKVVDGMVLFYPSIDAKTIESYSKNYPVVCIGTTGTSKVSRAGINDFEAAREAIDYLIGLGHRRIALLSDMQPLAFNAERERGCRAAMFGAGLELPEDMILSSRKQFFRYSLHIARYHSENDTSAEAFPQDVYDEYLRHYNVETIHAICEEYRAGGTVAGRGGFTGRAEDPGRDPGAVGGKRTGGAVLPPPGVLGQIWRPHSGTQPALRPFYP